jgi:membrane associated rhomboid family serine protease
MIEKQWILLALVLLYLTNPRDLPRFAFPLLEHINFHFFSIISKPNILGTQTFVGILGQWIEISNGVDLISLYLKGCRRCVNGLCILNQCVCFMGWEGTDCQVSSAGFIPAWSWIKWVVKRLYAVAGFDIYSLQWYQGKTCLLGIPIYMLPQGIVSIGRFFKLLNLFMKLTIPDILLIAMIFQFITLGLYKYLRWHYQLPTMYQLRRKPWLFLTSHFYHSSIPQFAYSVYQFYIITPIIVAKVGHDSFLVFLFCSMIMISTVNWYLRKWSTGLNAVILSMKLLLLLMARSPFDHLTGLGFHLFFSDLDWIVIVTAVIITLLFSKVFLW